MDLFSVSPIFWSLRIINITEPRPSRSLRFVSIGFLTLYIFILESTFHAFSWSSWKRKRVVIDKSREYSVPLYLERMNIRKPCLSYQIRPGSRNYIVYNSLHHELQWISQCVCVWVLSIVSNEVRRILYILPLAAPCFLFSFFPFSLEFKQLGTKTKTGDCFSRQCLKLALKSRTGG
jgi:hypothetical protein